MRVAIVADPLFVYAGAERVIEQILQLFPDADVFSLVDFLSGDDRRFLQGRPVKTSFIQNMPLSRRRFRHYLALWPIAIEQLDLRGYDLIVSSHNAVAHGVRTGPSQTHLCYTHSPMRYAWDMQEEYLESNHLAGLKGAFARYVLHNLRKWDVVAGQRPDCFIANSDFIARRIEKIYRRQAVTIYPPVGVDRFAVRAEKADHFVTAGRLVSYKRVDLIAQAFRGTPYKLVVVGEGPDGEALKRYECENVQFVGHTTHAELDRLVGSARAFIFAGIEDFGIAPVEAQAAGTPVIAYAAGGLTESVRGLDADRPTGLFFASQDVDAIRGAIAEFERNESRISPEACRANAMRFSESVFRDRLAAAIADALAGAGRPRPSLADTAQGCGTAIGLRPPSAAMDRMLS